MDQEQNSNLSEYTVKVGGKSYRFSKVGLVRSISGKWAINYGTIRPMLLSVARSMLAEDGAMKFDQLKFLMNLTEVSMPECAGYLGVDKDTFLQWKSDGELPEVMSIKARSKMAAFLLVDLMKKTPDFEIV